MTSLTVPGPPLVDSDFSGRKFLCASPDALATLLDFAAEVEPDEDATS
jgi:hypothetical protein